MRRRTVIELTMLWALSLLTSFALADLYGRKGRTIGLSGLLFIVLAAATQEDTSWWIGTLVGGMIVYFAIGRFQLKRR